MERAIALEVPTNESDRHALVFEKPIGWEYALYGSVLLDQLEKYETKYRDWQVGYVNIIGPRIQGTDVLDLLGDFQSRSLKLINNFNVLMAPDTYERAFGKPGEPGDSVLIEHLARRLIDVYGHLLATVAQLRAARVDDIAERTVRASAMMDDQPIEAIRAFVANYAESLNAALRTLRDTPEEDVHVELVLKLEIAEDIVKETSDAFDALERELLRP